MENTQKRKIRKRYITLGVIVLLVGIRLSLPYFVTKYVNKTLSELDGYSGSIEDVDLHLYRGAYKICELRLDKTDNKIKEPFLHIPTTDLSVQWKSIFKGAIVGEIEITDPTVTFGFGGSEAEQQNGTELDWVQLVTDLFPIDINRFAVVNGDVQLKNITASPDLNAKFSDFDVEILNIRNVEEKEDILPSTVTLTGTSSFGGTIGFNAKANLIKEFPDFNFDARAEGIDLTKFNAIIKDASGMTVEKGTLDLYTEMKAKDKNLDGYVKPLIHDIQIFFWKEKDRTFWQGVKEAFTEVAQELVENRRNWDELTAAKIPIRGTVDSTATGTWSAVISLLTNAYIERFKGVIDGTIEWQNKEGSPIAQNDNPKDEKLKK